MAFIHESIKTRVETHGDITLHETVFLHLSMNPLKQGLKRHDTPSEAMRLLMHLSMNPLKQGLKRRHPRALQSPCIAFIHESIKTRVETARLAALGVIVFCAFIHESIKTRVETYTPLHCASLRVLAFIHESIKTRVETNEVVERIGRLYRIYP